MKQLLSFLLFMYLSASPQEESSAFVAISALTVSTQNQIKDRFLNAATTATVRQGNSLCPEEYTYLHNRFPIAHQALEAFTEQSIAPRAMPFIAAIASGGGYRAMIATLGFFQGLEELGILDAVMYANTLSGSTWFLASWLAHNYNLDELQLFLQHQTARPFSLHDCEGDDISKTIFKKILARQKITLCDLWSGVISHYIFGDLPEGGQQIRLSSFQNKVSSGFFPMPIFTGVLDFGMGTTYKWFEFTPFEAGAPFLNAWVPSDSYGKKFVNGISTDKKPGFPLSYLVGLFGSAYAANNLEVLKFLYNKVSSLFEQNKGIQWPFEIFERFRLSPPMIRSINRGIEGTPYHTEKYHVIVDAGLDFNLPFPPVIDNRRPSNLIICCDASEGVSQGPDYNELKKVEAYAQRNNLKFPTIDYTNIATNEVSLFFDKYDPTVPVILYFPNKVQFPTLKFRYTEGEFKTLCSTMKKQIIDAAPTIKMAILLAYNNQQRLMPQGTNELKITTTELSLIKETLTS